jgi:hypothetical protein
MFRVEKEDNIRRILEALLNELSSRMVLEPSTIQEIFNEGRVVLPLPTIPSRLSM